MLEIQPPVTADHLGQLPAKRGVALLLAEGDHPIVLLPCADIRSRVSARMRNPQEDPKQKMPDLRGITRRIAWKLAGSHFETDLLFLELSQQIWPATYESLLAIKKAWFVHVDPAQKFPRFDRADDVLERPGQYLGPFESGRSADRFVQAVQEAFDLCRDYRCLRQAPNAARCSYGQMGRCLCPCDGSISLDAYRQAVAQAARYAAGQRTGLRDDLAGKMRQAAASLEFEKASAIKARLERLGALDGEEFRHVAPAEDFRFLLVQPGGGRAGGRGKAAVFYADGGTIVRLPPLKYPATPPEIEALLGQLDRDSHLLFADASQAARQKEPQDAALAQWRIALVSHALYCSPERSGLIVRVTPALTADVLAGLLDQWAPVLRLLKPARPPGAKKPSAPADGQTQ